MGGGGLEDKEGDTYNLDKEGDTYNLTAGRGMDMLKVKNCRGGIQTTGYSIA